MDVHGIYTYYDYMALTILYLSALLAIYIVKWFLSLFRYSDVACRFIASTVVPLGCTLLYATRSLWEPGLPADIHRGLIAQAVATIWWLSLGYHIMQILDFFVWSGIFTRHGQLIVPKILTDLIRAFIASASVVFMLHYVYDQPITGVLATSGVLAIVLGYSAQSSLSHVFAGLSLNLNPNFSQGDYVEIDGRWGRVIDMNWRYVTLQDADENYLSIPNSVVANATIKNFMHPTSRRGLTLYVTVPHDISPVVVKALLLQATKASPNVLDAEGGPWITLSELTEDGARYQIAFYITGPFNSGVKDEVLSAVWYSLQRQGIPIAINRREVIVQPPTVKEMLDYTESVFKLLHNIPLFHTLRDPELREIAAGSRRFVYGPPECIIQENDTGSSLFIVENGLLDVYAQQSDQSSLKMAEIGPGSVFGEMALLTGEPRSATIRAASEVSVYEISKSTLQPILQNRPELIEELSMLLATRQLDAEMKSSAYQSEHAVRQTTVDSIAIRIAGSIRAFFHSDSDC